MYKILQHITSHWKREFTGTSALEVAEVFNITHERAIEEFNKLSSQGFISVQKAKLGQPIKFKKLEMNRTIVKIVEDWEMAETLIAFPKREILEKVFIQECKDYGIFTNRLHKGDSQIKHYFFKQDVLGKYFQYAERYRIEDDVTGGVILTRDKYYFSLPEGIRDNETFGQIRYGKRRLANGEFVVAVIVSDLSGLPLKEQAYWFSFEVENPEFADGDEDFEKYWRESFDAEFIDHEDLLQEILKTIMNINRIAGFKIFKNDTENPYLKYPIVNNREAYCNAHKELFKLIGRDSIDKNTVGKILQDYFAEIKNETHDKGQWALFKLLIEKISTIDFNSFQTCHDAASEDRHRISEAELENMNFIQQFCSDCTGILEGLKKLESFLMNNHKINK